MKFSGKLSALNFLLNPKMAIPLIIALTIRLSLAPFTEHRWDMYTWRLHQAFVYEYNVNPFWLPSELPAQTRVFCWSYTPLWLLTLLLVYPIYRIVTPFSLYNNITDLWAGWRDSGYEVQDLSKMYEAYHDFVPLNLPLLDLVTKAPMILADILIAVLLYKMVKDFSTGNKANYVYIAWLFNPFNLWISSVWGMFDHIPTLFVLLALYYLFKRRYDGSALLLGVAISLKMYPLLLIPVFALACYKESKNLRDPVKYCLISGGFTFLVAFSSYFIAASVSGQEPLSLTFRLMSSLFRGRASPDWFGQNMFSGLTPLIILDTVFKRLHLDSLNVPISPILMGVAVLLILMTMYRKKAFSKLDFVSYVAVTHFVIYLTYAAVNEQYLTWVLPLLLLVTLEKGGSSLRYLYWIITGMGLLAIIYRYDLSYFVSPYFLWNPLGLSISLEILEILVFVAVLITIYSVSIKLILKETRRNKDKRRLISLKRVAEKPKRYKRNQLYMTPIAIILPKLPFCFKQFITCSVANHKLVHIVLIRIGK